MLRLLRILPADHAVREDDGAHAGELGAAKLLVFSIPAERAAVAVGAEDGGVLGVIGPLTSPARDRFVQIAGAEEAGKRFQGDVLDGVAVELAPAVDDRLERRLLWQRPELGASEKTLTHSGTAVLNILCRLETRL